jgi:uncharacterized protein with NRDE domain
VCLVVFAWRAHPDYKLIVAGNRDESHERPTQDAHWWPDSDSILGGRDLQAGGTWLAVSRSGRFATVTNFREGQRSMPEFRSRGALVTGFVAGSQSLEEFESSISNERYAGFSLLASDGDSMFYLSNRDDLEADLAPGVYGLSNASLDTPWSKVVRARAGLECLIRDDDVNETGLLRLLTDRRPAAIELPFEIARAISAPFIVAPDYGTRSSTAVLWGVDGTVQFTERRFDRSGKPTGDSRFRFVLEASQPQVPLRDQRLP